MLSGLWLLWIALATVLADSLVVRVAVDDRQFDRLDSPKVIIEGLETALLDNGALPGDVASDKIYVGQINIQHQQSIVLRVLNVDGTTIGEVEVSVPKASSATYQLKTSEKGVVLDLNAPNMPIREAKAQMMRRLLCLFKVRSVRPTVWEKEIQNSVSNQCEESFVAGTDSHFERSS